MQEQSSHIYTYGELQDYLTKEILPDTDDERIRQGLARLLVEERGFTSEELRPRQYITTTIAGQCVISRIDLIVLLGNLPLMLFRCAPGSLVSRERAAIAAARLYHPRYQLPLAVVYNGQNAELLDCHSGKHIASGIDAIPSRQQLEAQWLTKKRQPLQDHRAQEWERRILNAFDLEQCCTSNTNNHNET